MTGGIAPRLDRIVIGMDFGEPALAAARWVAEEFAPEAELVLVHALGVEPAPLGAALRTMPEPVVGVAREFAGERLGRVAGALGGNARSEVREGSPAPVISEVAHACGADLIVVGPHGGGADRPHGVGSTAERLVRASSIPVLVAIHPPNGRPRRVLVPVDDVDLTATVLEWAALLMRRDGAAVTLLHIVDASSAAEAGRTWLTRLARDIRDGSDVAVDVMVGTPGEAIGVVARRTGVDLIAMGRRGKGRVFPGVLGSTVNVVLRETECPVLIVVDAADAILDEWGTEAETTGVS